MSTLSTVGKLGDRLQSHNRNLRLALGASGLVGQREKIGELSTLTLHSLLIASRLTKSWIELRATPRSANQLLPELPFEDAEGRPAMSWNVGSLVPGGGNVPRWVGVFRL